MTPELRDGPLGGDKKGSRGDPLAQKCRNVVAAQLSMLHPNEAFLFIGKIPKMLAQQGIDGYQQPEDLASDTVGTTGTITLNEPERKALQRIVARHPLDGFEEGSCSADDPALRRQLAARAPRLALGGHRRESASLQKSASAVVALAASRGRRQRPRWRRPQQRCQASHRPANCAACGLDLCPASFMIGGTSGSATKLCQPCSSQSKITQTRSSSEGSRKIARALGSVLLALLRSRGREDSHEPVEVLHLRRRE